MLTRTSLSPVGCRGEGPVLPASTMRTIEGGTESTSGVNARQYKRLPGACHAFVSKNLPGQSPLPPWGDCHGRRSRPLYRRNGTLRWDRGPVLRGNGILRRGSEPLSRGNGVAPRRGGPAYRRMGTFNAGRDLPAAVMDIGDGVPGLPPGVMVPRDARRLVYGGNGSWRRGFGLVIWRNGAFYAKRSRIRTSG